MHARRTSTLLAHGVMDNTDGDSSITATAEAHLEGKTTTKGVTKCGDGSAMTGGSRCLKWIQCHVPIPKRPICISMSYHHFWVPSRFPFCLFRTNHLRYLVLAFLLAYSRRRFSCFDLQSQAQNHEAAGSTRVVFRCGQKRQVRALARHHDPASSLS